jgi:hypothetical protein
MRVAIITTPREPSYVDETVVQVRAGLPERFPLDAFTDIPGHRVDGVTTWWMRADRVMLAAPMRRFQRAALNFLSALESGDDEIVLFEDDVAVKPTWLEDLTSCVYVSGADLVSMYWPSDEMLEPQGPGEAWRRFRRPVTFHGSLGLWMSAPARAGLVRHIERKVALHCEGEDPLLPFDNLVASYLNSEDALASVMRMVATVPALVDHRGEVSAIEENRDHGPRRSPGY